MNAADCLLVTSRTEGSPTIIKEALACNLPVVSVDVGDAAERLRGVSPSYIVKSDPKEIAAALTKVLSGRERSNGREHIVALSDKEIAERLCSIYAAILS
jgi:glycosyltransferase involved in cell wall biosynthesis